MSYHLYVKRDPDLEPVHATSVCWCTSDGHPLRFEPTGTYTWVPTFEMSDGDSTPSINPAK